MEIEAQAGTPGTGFPLSDLSSKFPANAVVAAIENKEGAHVASGDTVVNPGDHVIVVAINKAVPDVVRLFSTEKAAIRTSVTDGEKP